jgi:hypothetical protein
LLLTSFLLTAIGITEGKFIAFVIVVKPVVARDTNMPARSGVVPLLFFGDEAKESTKEFDHFFATNLL